MARHKIEVKRGSGMKTLRMLLKYMFLYYRWQLILVICCIAVTAVAGISSSIFLEILTDDVITPGLEPGFEAVKGTLYTIIGIMAGLSVVSLLCLFPRLLYTFDAADELQCGGFGGCPVHV